MPGTIFDKILDGEIPSDKVHDDDICYAFRDISPQAPVHILVIPKVRNIPQISKLPGARPEHSSSDVEVVQKYNNIVGHCMRIAGEIGNRLCPNGFRLVVNDGKAGCQTVYHLHIHILGGRQLTWPPG